MTITHNDPLHSARFAIPPRSGRRSAGGFIL